MGKKDDKNSVSEADSELFRQLVGEVKPVKQDHADLQSAKPAPRAKQQERDDKQVLIDMLSDHHEHLETGEELQYQQTGLQKNTFRKLRRGQFRIDAETDLHGHNSDEARKALVEFLQESKHQGYRCVRIIHGKASFREGGPVIKPLVNSWLRQRSEVLAFCSARPNDGGTGAVYVLLKQG